LGAARVVPVVEVSAALQYREREPDAVLGGERHGRGVAGVDAGNSPPGLRGPDLRGHTVVHTTHAGTAGLLAADAADEGLTGSFVNISAGHRYLRERSPNPAPLVRMGSEARERCLEDDLYAEALQRMLENCDGRLETVRDTLRGAPAAAKFFDPAWDWAQQGDF